MPWLLLLGWRMPGSSWIGDWLDPRTGLDVLEKRNIIFFFWNSDYDSSHIEPIS